MAYIPHAEPSPRIVNGEIHWYQGDTFSIELHLDLRDQDDTPIEIVPDDTVRIIFRDRKGTDMNVFDTFTGIVNNVVTLDFNTARTAKFIKGEYQYDVVYTGQNRTTIANDNRVVVE